MPSDGDAARVALVVGPTGATGKAVTTALARQGGWTVYGASRTEPGGTPSFRHVAADLTRPGTLAPALAGLAPVTHGFFCARAPFAEGGVEDVPLNIAMLEAMLDGLEASSLRLEHVHLLEGTKWYGMHLGPYRTPAREGDPRHLPPNFYYDQQDLLERRARRGGWGWSASRPSFICGFAPERPRNLVPTLGAYAAICRALGVPLDFPGTAEGYAALNEVTDADVLGDAVLFTATHPTARNQAFNVTNGDCFRWQTVWPKLADWCGLPCGVPRDIRLATWMRDKGPVWDHIVAEHGLQPRPLDQVAAWDFADFVCRQQWDVLSDLGRLRRAGFNACVDTVALMLRQMAQNSEARLLPPA
ncbi:MAG: SDR family oxidoreductase [Catenulispora sp.]